MGGQRELLVFVCSADVTVVDCVQVSHVTELCTHRLVSLLSYQVEEEHSADRQTVETSREGMVTQRVQMMAYVSEFYLLSGR